MSPAPTEDLPVEFATRLFELFPLGIHLSDAQGRCIYTNSAYRQIAGLTRERALGMRWNMSVHPDDRQRAADEWAAAVPGGKPFRAEVRILRPDGSIIWVRLNAGTGAGACGPSANLLMVEDISERKAVELLASKAEEVLYAEKERAQVTLDSIGDAVLVTDLAGKLTYMNREAETLTGWSSEKSLGRSLTEIFNIVDGKTRITALNPAQQAIEEDRTVGLAADCLLVRFDGTEVAIEDSAAPIHGRDGTVAGAVIVFHDVAHSRAETSRMSYLAHHDELTGLVRPALLRERLTQAIGLAERHRKQLGLLFIDLNLFKEVNDLHGHEAGDQVLKAVAERLANCVRETDTVCRRGGDEFVILLAEIKGRQGAAVVAEKVLAALAPPHVLAGTSARIGASIGIGVFPYDGEEVESLMRSADTAMYEAKKSGQTGYRFAPGTHWSARRAS